MLFDITGLFADPEAYVCAWRNGELYIELLAGLSATASVAQAGDVKAG